MVSRRIMLGMLSVVILVCSSAAFAQKRAVVVGVNEYPYLYDATLAGCTKDAEQMAAELKSRGFVVTKLTDSQATHDGIIRAIRLCKGATAFVFSASLHGSRGLGANGKAVAYILPYDTKPSGANVLDSETLHREVRALGADAATVILDSCFSGAMMKSGLPDDDMRRLGLKSKFYNLNKGSTSRSLQEHPSNRSDGDQFLTLNNSVGAGGVCYFTATAANQIALAGPDGSVFTNGLLKSLPTPDSRWGTLQSAVARTVLSWLQSNNVADRFPMDPQLSPGFSTKVYFENKEPATASPILTNLADVYHIGEADPNVLTMEVFVDGQPDTRPVISLGSELSFVVTTKRPGYLVVLNKDEEGKVGVIYPRSGKASDAYCATGDTRRIPEAAGNVFSPDKRGYERIKAVLCGTSAAAQKILSAFGSKSVPVDGLAAKLLVETASTAGGDKINTCEIGIAVE